MNYPHPIIAKEGWSFIALNLMAIFFSALFLPKWITLILFLGLIFVIQFFRDPPRPVPELDDVVLCPADGRVIKIEETKNPYTDEDSLLISVFMNVFNVHSNRISVDGSIKKLRYFAGSFVNADLDKASAENERNAVVIERADGTTITQVQIAGLIARRILCYVREADKVHKGERYGFIRFGSRVDMYLPKEAIPCVSIGDKVKASSTILATL